MDTTKRTRLVAGILFILAGLWFFAAQLIPGLSWWMRISYSWPLIIIAVGAGLLFIGLLTGAPGMAVPACIVAGIGVITYFQNLSGDWPSWSYAWTLIPGFVGIGTLLAGLLGGSMRHSIQNSIRLMITSLILFLVFGFFFGGFSFMNPYGPLALIVAGILILINVFIRKS
jgi:hypothetical protein